MSIQHVAAVLDARDERLAGCRKLVLIALANRTDQYGKCWPSQDLVAGECGISTRSLSEHLKGLEDDGFIIRDTQHLGQGRGSRTTYTLVLVSLKIAPEQIAPAKFAPEKNVVCTGSTPRVTNLQEPTSSSSYAREVFQNRRDEILAACQARANGFFANGPSWNDFVPILNLLAPETGTPCDLESDVLPAVVFKADQAKKTGKPIKSWTWIGERAVENRDRRLAGLPAVVAPAKRATDRPMDDLDKALARNRKNG